MSNYVFHIHSSFIFQLQIAFCHSVFVSLVNRIYYFNVFSFFHKKSLYRFLSAYFFKFRISFISKNISY